MLSYVIGNYLVTSEHGCYWFIVIAAHYWQYNYALAELLHNINS